MKNQAIDDRLARGNKMTAALKVETHRGRACVGDAMLDELFKQLFKQRLVDQSKEVTEILSDGRPLGNHGTRVRVAFLLGWIGPETFADCLNIRKIRNKMAHQLDVDSFEHEAVRDLVDALESPRRAQIEVRGQTKRLNLRRREDRFVYAVLMTVMRCWRLIDDSNHAPAGVDVPIVRVQSPGTDPRG